MKIITESHLGKQAVSAIKRVMLDENELIISVDGKEEYVVMNTALYKHLRDCEMEMALHTARADNRTGNIDTKAL